MTLFQTRALLHSCFVPKSNSCTTAILIDKFDTGSFECTADSFDVVCHAYGCPRTGLHSPERWNGNTRRRCQIGLLHSDQSTGCCELTPRGLIVFAHVDLYLLTLY